MAKSQSRSDFRNVILVAAFAESILKAFAHTCNQLNWK